jgi:isoleucyl-tRNA synthetase
VLVFTSEEVWGTRYPDGGSIHLLEWPELTLTRHLRESGGPASSGASEDQRDSRFRGNDGMEVRWADLRELRTQVTEAIEPLRRDKVLGSSLEAEVSVPSSENPEFLAELFITSTVHQGDLKVVKTDNHKCGRCWRYLPEVREDGELCGRCDKVVNG